MLICSTYLPNFISKHISSSVMTGPCCISRSRPSFNKTPSLTACSRSCGLTSENHSVSPSSSSPLSWYKTILFYTYASAENQQNQEDKSIRNALLVWAHSSSRYQATFCLDNSNKKCCLKKQPALATVCGCSPYTPPANKAPPSGMLKGKSLPDHFWMLFINPMYFSLANPLLGSVKPCLLLQPPTAANPWSSLYVFWSIFIESQNSFGWKGPSKLIQSNTPAISRDTFN